MHGSGFNEKFTKGSDFYEVFLVVPEGAFEGKADPRVVIHKFVFIGILQGNVVLALLVP